MVIGFLPNFETPTAYSITAREKTVVEALWLLCMSIPELGAVPGDRELDGVTVGTQN